MGLTISELQRKCFEASHQVGWWDNLNASDPFVFATKIALVHSELSEALEGARKNLPDDHLPHRSSVEVELADAIIRILDLAGAIGLDIEGAIGEKMAYNAKRADHKRENRLEEHGKRF